MDYDRVMVLDEGRLVEFDSVASLLATDSAFHRMCQESGDYAELLSRSRDRSN